MKILSFGIDKYVVSYAKENGCTFVFGSAEHSDMLKDLIECEAPSVVTVNLDEHPWMLCEIGSIRRKKVNVPIAGICSVVEGTCPSEQRALFLESGGNDLIHTPVSGREFVASLRSMHHLHVGAPQLSVIEVCIGSAVIVLNTTIHQLTVDGTVIPLTSKQFRILEILMEYPGKVVKHETMIDTLYGFLDVPLGNNIQVFISRIKKKMWNINTDAVEMIEAIPAVGYRIRV